MPLMHSGSKKAFSHNLKTEMHEGKPMKQSLAIAYALKKRGKKMAKGGSVDAEKEMEDYMDKESMVGEDMAKDEVPEVDPMDEAGEFMGYMAKGGDVERAHKEDERMLGQHGEDEQGPYGAEMTHEPDRMIEHDVMDQSKGKELDMIDHIMAKRQKHFSKGGRVANTDLPTAMFEPNEFDDLHLRDDLESSYTGANSGDELGDDREDMDRKDMVAMIMKSRAKKDRLPKIR